jgi:sugar lactone lactonase YvrE
MKLYKAELVVDSRSVLGEGPVWNDETKHVYWVDITGKRLYSYDAQYVTSCIFAGDNRDELYITTAAQQLSDEQLRNQPHAGGLFRVKTGHRGAPTYKFGVAN